MKVHESIVLFSSGKFTYNPQMTDGIPYKKRGEHNVNKNGGMFGIKDIKEKLFYVGLIKEYENSICK